MAGFVHLARRFVAALWPAGPSTREARWAEQQLLEGERRLWLKMSGPDRRHAVGVARRVEGMLADRATRPVLAAALLHDVGKIEARLGTVLRVPATLVGMAADAEEARDWQRGSGLKRRVGLYLRHDEIGADLLAMAGSDPLTVTWAREHHLPPQRWTLPTDLARALKAADDD